MAERVDAEAKHLITSYSQTNSQEGYYDLLRDVLTSQNRLSEERFGEILDFRRLPRRQLHSIVDNEYEQCFETTFTPKTQVNRSQRAKRSGGTKRVKNNLKSYPADVSSANQAKANNGNLSRAQNIHYE